MPKDKTKVEIFKSLEDFADKSTNKTTRQELKQQVQDQLLKAIQKPNSDEMAKLIKDGAIIDEKILAEGNKEPFYMFNHLTLRAVRRNDLDLIRLLIKSNAIDQRGIINAASNGNLDIIKEFLKIKDLEPIQLEYAASEVVQKDHLHVFKYLRDQGITFQFPATDSFSQGTKIARWEIANGRIAPFHYEGSIYRSGSAETTRFIFNDLLRNNPQLDRNEILRQLLLSDLSLRFANVSTLSNLGASIDFNKFDENIRSTVTTELKGYTRLILNSGTIPEAIVAGLNILNAFEGLSATDEMNTFKLDLRKLLKEKLQEFDPKPETQNIKEYFKKKCIGDLDDYIQQLNGTSLIIQKYKGVYQKDPEFSKLMNKFESSGKKLAQNLQNHKIELLIDHIVFDTRPDTASELQKIFKGRMMKESQTKERNPFFEGQNALLGELLNYYSSKDLGDLGVSYLKISDLQQEVKKEKQKIYDDLNEQRSNKALEQLKSWAQKISTKKSQNTIER